MSTQWTLPWGRRLLAGAAVAAAVAMSACSVTTNNYSCSNNRCEVTLSGSGSETELYDDTLSLRLDSADGSTAELTVGNESVSCAEGETVQAADVSVTCDSVGDDEVTLTVE